jgi:hypothetical protein
VAHIDVGDVSASLALEGDVSPFAIPTSVSGFPQAKHCTKRLMKLANLKPLTFDLWPLTFDLRPLTFDLRPLTLTFDL